MKLVFVQFSAVRFYILYDTVSIIGLNTTRPGYTLWFGLVRTVYPGLGGQRLDIDTVLGGGSYYVPWSSIIKYC